MLQFIIGLLVGGIFGFAVCAICSIARTDDKTKIPCREITGEDDA